MPDPYRLMNKLIIAAVVKYGSWFVAGFLFDLLDTGDT